MKKQFVLIGIVILFISVVFSGCNTPQKYTLDGTYVSEEEGSPSYTFYNNGSVYIIMPGQGGDDPSEYWATYTLSEKTITIDGTSYKYTISANHQQLVLNDHIPYQKLED